MFFSAHKRHQTQNQKTRKLCKFYKKIIKTSIKGKISKLFRKAFRKQYLLKSLPDTPASSSSRVSQSCPLFYQTGL